MSGCLAKFKLSLFHLCVRRHFYLLLSPHASPYPFRLKCLVFLDRTRNQRVWVKRDSFPHYQTSPRRRVEERQHGNRDRQVALFRLEKLLYETIAIDVMMNLPN